MQAGLPPYFQRLDGCPAFLLVASSDAGIQWAHTQKMAEEKVGNSLNLKGSLALESKFFSSSNVLVPVPCAV